PADQSAGRCALRLPRPEDGAAMTIQDRIAIELAAGVPDVQSTAPTRPSLLRRLARDKAAAVAALFLAAVALMAIFAPFVAPYDPYATDLAHAMQLPSAQH